MDHSDHNAREERSRRRQHHSQRGVAPQEQMNLDASPDTRGGGGATQHLSTATRQNTGASDMEYHQFPNNVRALRPPTERPLIKLSVSLIGTYKHINRVYYEERNARHAARAAQRATNVQQQGVHNNGYDDEHYDYIIRIEEVFNDRYIIKEKIGKGSFGQVVRAVDKQTNRDVAIKIIKSKKPFMQQAKTEIDLLVNLCQNDSSDQNNIVRLISHFVFRNHQCLVFEMLSLNLYELLKNTQFRGVSLNLIRKFAKQILKALQFLAQPDVDIIHCDLKPENILLRHPKRSAVKVIDFGSSCKSNKRMYSYIQSRFYRSPEVMLGLPYTVSIDMWSLGCILVEMHTGEPLFSGSDQFDQIQKLVEVLGMVPSEMIDRSPENHRSQFFIRSGKSQEPWALKQRPVEGEAPDAPRRSSPGQLSKSEVARSLSEIVGADIGGPRSSRRDEPGHSPADYNLFVDLIQSMLDYDPNTRIKSEEALRHPFILDGSSHEPQPLSSSRHRSRSNPVARN
mmetsp:Transcript_17457/g.34752  ORF Transcript_17457/g.34752 Transcript_17457/m.34752 type:complete len:510 (+) Transcript_17457:1034-2563(+)|eukprot:CAMPEP_0194306678 /NCGR_PEP_ID=MMETSP0171-20130528/3737_1 /TAXON_ID=218684 /ORGANISM="Corethron pennatum, Strain L29A3" /LENGTH=509 /DNA_ID=CAMNT_0039058507 /DNA_START=954 /DNA_END=2483 /DNA_ORIENTATION=-